MDPLALTLLSHPPLRRRNLVFATAILALLPIAAVPAAAQEKADVPASALPLRTKGPLPTRNYEPLNAPQLLPMPADGFVLGRGQIRHEANLDIVNHLLTLPPRYVTDFEDQRLTLSYHRGIGGGQEVGVRIPLVSRNGGVLDGFVDDWHKWFGFEGGGRGNLPRERVQFVLRDRAGTANLVNRPGAATGIGDVVLEYRRALTGESERREEGLAVSPRRFAASARALVKLPTGRSDILFGSGAADFGLGLAATLRPARRVALHGNLSVVAQGDADLPGYDVRSSVVHSMVAVEWMMDRRTSFVAQTDDNPSPYRTGDDYADRTRRGFTFGFWRQISRRDLAYLSLSENDFGPLAKQAPDVTLSIGIRSGW